MFYVGSQSPCIKIAAMRLLHCVRNDDLVISFVIAKPILHWLLQSHSCFKVAAIGLLHYVLNDELTYHPICLPIYFLTSNEIASLPSQ